MEPDDCELPGDCDAARDGIRVRITARRILYDTRHAAEGHRHRRERDDRGRWQRTLRQCNGWLRLDRDPSIGHVMQGNGLWRLKHQERPNGMRLSCGAGLERSQTEFYNTRRRRGIRIPRGRAPPASAA